MPHTKAVELERLEKHLGLEELTDRMSRYLDDDDKWLLQHKHPLGIFITRINSYEDPEPSVQPHSRYLNCPKCHTLDRGHLDKCSSCDWTREAWEAERKGDDPR